MTISDTKLFVLANVMSWLAWVPYILSQSGVGIWSYQFPDTLGSSQILGVLPGAYLGPIASALFVTAVADGRAGLRRWVGRMWRWRVRWHWYAITLLGVPAAMLAFCIAFNIVMTWVFNRTGESVPLAMSAHVSVNNFASIMWSEIFPTIDSDRAMQAMSAGAVVTCVLVLIGTRGRLGYPAPGPGTATT